VSSDEATPSLALSRRFRREKGDIWMKVIRRLAALTAVATVAAGVAVAVLPPAGAGAHGVAMMPGARTFLCYQDGIRSTGEIIPFNPACADAVAQGGTQPLYDWFGVLRSDAGGRTIGFVPDGQICGGGTTKYAAYNAARTDWPVTHLTSGATVQFRYSNWAAHPGTFQLYVTRDGWNPLNGLNWSDLVAFASVTDPPQSGVPGTFNYYFWTGQLPVNKTGRHIIYMQWVRSDSQENFFSCSDVVFDGGNGEVTGVGPNGTQPPSTSTPPVTTTPPRTTPPVTTTPPRTTPPVTTTPPAGNGACTASFKVVSSWSGAFQGEFTVTAGSSAVNGWTVGWTNGTQQSVTQLWGGVHTASGATSTVRNAAWNGNLAAGASTTFGFLASGPGAPSVNAITCTSP
jgi:predicted carbohydrate-binding protein with CBM5 and CBM33 domain